MLTKCPCSSCALFYDIEGEGYEDTGNGFHIVYCLDGKSRSVSIDTGCSDYAEDEWAGIKEIQ